MVRRLGKDLGLALCDLEVVFRYLVHTDRRHFTTVEAVTECLLLSA